MEPPLFIPAWVQNALFVPGDHGIGGRTGASAVLKAPSVLVAAPFSRKQVGGCIPTALFLGAVLAEISIVVSCHDAPLKQLASDLRNSDVR
jgi:hypothetical protein